MGIILLDWARQSSPLTSPRHSSQITDNLKSHLWSWNMNCAYKGKWGLLRRTQIWGGVKGFSCGSDGKQAACNAGDPGSIPQSGRSSGEGNGNALQYSCLEKSTTEEPGGLQSMGLKRVGHDWVTTLSLLMHFMGFPGGASGKECTGQFKRWRDTGSIPGSGRAPGGGHHNPLQHSCLENPIDRGAWWATIHRVTQSDTMKQLSIQHTCNALYRGKKVF